MSQTTLLQTSNAKPNASDGSGLLLQRKCACGSNASALTGACEECGKKTMLGLQTKLKISEPGDSYEQEADRIAEQVMATPAHAVSGLPPRIQRLAAQTAGQMEAAPASVDHVLASPGRALDPATRAFFEPRFGHDFSQVRVHSYAAAEQSAQDVNAYAYTVGHNIVFGPDRFQPGTGIGRRLLAHELTHVVQQTGDVAAPATMLARDPDNTNDELARTLARKLDKKRDEVLNTLGGLAEKDLRALDAAAAKILPRNQSEALGRAIRFVVHKPATLPPATPVTVVGEGTSESKAKAKVAGGEVELHTGVSYKSGAGDSNSAYSLSYDGPGVAEMRWLQFVWREVVPEFPATARGGKPRNVPHKKRIDRPSGPYFLTTDPAKPKWNTDSATGRSAFYEENTTVNRSATKLVMFDAPDTMVDVVKNLFANTANPPTRVVSHFHATTYLIQGMDVLYRAEIDLTWEFTEATKPPSLKVIGKGGKAKRLEFPQRARLVSQYPDVDYLPGPAIGAPQPLDAFDPIPDLAPKGSITEKDWPNKSDLEKYEDIALLAHAELIDDVTGKSSTSITQVSGATGHASGVRPGLNYWANLTPEGETGFIDAKGAYHNPDLPIDADGPLPGVAIILGPDAFARDKAFALSVMRHEMQHAAHNQLAIGWLLKWRDERTGKSFKDWLGEEQRSNRLSEAELALVLTGVTSNTAATEVLAHTEGFVTALPFLPAKPEFRLMASGDNPAAISALKGAGQQFNAVSSKPVKKAALERIRGFSCSALTQKQRDALVEWILFLLDPNSLKPTKADESTVKLMNNDFPPLKDFLHQVLVKVKKACPK